MRYGLCKLACIPVRRDPNLTCEMTSQLLYGERFECLQDEGHFGFVRILPDGYTGWIDLRQTESLDEEEFHRLGENRVLSGSILHTARHESGQIHLPRGCTLPDYRGDGTYRYLARTYRFEGEIAPGADSASVETFLKYLKEYENAPYLWGGRTPFGLDCSGLVQMVWAAFGINLPRDSPEQAAIGQPITRLSEALCGDLAYFGSSLEGNSHVGIIVPGGITHASGYVRTDDLDEDGILHRENGQRTHRLVAIRRVGELKGQQNSH